MQAMCTSLGAGPVEIMGRFTVRDLDGRKLHVPGGLMFAEHHQQYQSQPSNQPTKSNQIQSNGSILLSSLVLERHDLVVVFMPWRS